MDDQRLEPGRKYHCREETTGKHVTGVLEIQEDDIRVRLHSYGEALEVDCDGWLSLRTENNWIVTLHNNFVAGKSTSYGEALTTYVATVMSNVALIGRNSWTPTDLVRHVSFGVPHAEHSLRHKPTYDRIANTKLGLGGNSEIFSTRVGTMEVSAFYAIAGSSEFDHPTIIEPRIIIEFDAGLNLMEYRVAVQCVVRFFSALVGQALHASGIEISRLSSDERLREIESQNYQGDHQVRELAGRKSEFASRDIWAGHQFAHSVTNEERDAFVACLTAWIDRDVNWKRPTSLMMESMVLEGEISARRLMAAWQWFEEIPDAKSVAAIKADHVKAIAASARATAASLGYDSDIVGRVEGAIKVLADETRGKRFARLVGEITDAFGDELLCHDIRDALSKANTFRNKIAHGYFATRDDEEYLEFCWAIYAMECFCYLLTIKDLPILPAARSRIRRLPIVANFLHCTRPPPAFNC